MMCDTNDTKAKQELTGMAARFIAEANAFLDQFWADPSVRWPMKGNLSEDLGLRSVGAPAEGRGGITSELAASVKVEAVPELIAQIKWLQQSQPADGTTRVIDANGAPPVYIIFMLVPEEAPCRAAGAVTRTRINGVPSDNGRPIALDAPPPPPASRKNDQPRRWRAAASATG